jgi:hypothetical protein
MGYFPNSTSWEIWAADNCFKCAHWPKDEDGPPCPVEMAHMLFNYDQEPGDPVEIILSALIPQESGGIGNERCAMFHDKHNLSDRHLRDWAKYKALMAERDAQRVIEQ